MKQSKLAEQKWDPNINRGKMECLIIKITNTDLFFSSVREKSEISQKNGTRSLENVVL